MTPHSRVCHHGGMKVKTTFRTTDATLSALERLRRQLGERSINEVMVRAVAELMAKHPEPKP